MHETSKTIVQTAEHKPDRGVRGVLQVLWVLWGRRLSRGCVDGSLRARQAGGRLMPRVWKAHFLPTRLSSEVSLRD